MKLRSNISNERVGEHIRRPVPASTNEQRVTDELAPASTVEALLYSCRQGPKVLEQLNNVHRIGQLSEGQLYEVCDRIQRLPADLKYEGARAVSWSAEQASTLFNKWVETNGRKV